VYSGVAGQLVRPAEALCATGEGANMRLLACVSSYVSRLMFESVEGLVTKRTFVWAWHLTLALLGV
jgi:hypothetical protein